MQNYPWAANREKLARAVGKVGPDASEATVREEYVRIAGLVLNDDGTKDTGPLPEVLKNEPEEDTGEEKPAKKTKKK